MTLVIMCNNRGLGVMVMVVNNFNSGLFCIGGGNRSTLKNTFIRRVLRYHRSDQNSYIEEEQTTQ